VCRTKSSVAFWASVWFATFPECDVLAEANIALQHMGLSTKYTSMSFLSPPFHTVNTDAWSAVSIQGNVSGWSRGGRINGWRNMSWQMARSWWPELRIFNVGRLSTKPDIGSGVEWRLCNWRIKFRGIS
jgi:hypothetical protein